MTAGPGARFLAGRSHAERGRAVRPSLEAMRTVLGRLGHPETAAPTVHVTGTNGKSSTARAVAGLLGGAGLRVGLYTSPHLRSVAERVELSGAPIDEGRLEASLAAVAGAADGWQLGFFEAMTAAAFVALAEAGVEAAVVEVGILGRHDPTNLVRSEVAVITNVGRDHLDYAGDEPGAVAREKAGIVKATTGAVVLGEARAELVEAVEAELRASGSPARPVALDRELHVAPLPPGGDGRRRWALQRPGAGTVAVALDHRFEARNACTALVAAEALLGRHLPDTLSAPVLEDLRLPGRGEVRSRSPLVVADVAHNPEAAATLREVLDDALGEAGRAGRAVAFVVGMTGARSPDGFLAPLVRPGDTVLACRTDGSPGAVPPEVVAAAAASLGASAAVVAEPADAWAVALDLARSGAVGAAVGTGSFRVVAAAPPAS